MRRVDYDHCQHQVYAQGRAISPQALQNWIGAFSRHAGPSRPQTVLDLGSGTGRFTPALADEFGGPVLGVEPSVRMREIAIASAPHPAVMYLDGRAERIPLPDRSCDLALLFLVLHHVVDRRAAARELARVLRPGGKLLIRSTLPERQQDLLWYRYFPRARAVEARVFPSLAEIERLFTAAGFSLVEVTAVRHPIAGSLAEYAGRLKLRAISTFEHLDEEEIVAGFARMDADAAAQAADPRPIAEDCQLLVLARTAAGRAG